MCSVSEKTYVDLPGNSGNVTIGSEVNVSHNKTCNKIVHHGIGTVVHNVEADNRQGDVTYNYGKVTYNIVQGGASDPAGEFSTSFWNVLVVGCNGVIVKRK